MSFSGFLFNGKHSFHDLGLTMPPTKIIGYPSKKKILVDVPFSNEQHDFSAIYGDEPAYTPRPLSYEFNIYNLAHLTPESMNIKKIAISNWLYSANRKSKLYDDQFPGYYFLAEIQNAMDFENNWKMGILKFEFEAYPFMISELKEGHDIWDDFNFELDIAQHVDYEIRGSRRINLYNAGIPGLKPKITATSPMTIQKGDRSFSVPAGESQSLDFILSPGINSMTVTGDGSISFNFHKEVI